jgi:hypothetical protein
MRNVILLILACLVFFSCSDKNPAGPSAIASEIWTINDVGTQNYADLTMSLLSDSAVAVHGKWYYDFYGNEITCTFMNGSAAVNDTTVSMTASGAAAYPPDSSGYVESSGFTLQMQGTFKDGTSRGTWDISFTKQEWQGWIDPGTFTGTLQSGGGVTHGTH